jgi:hypothetical protein
MLDRFSGSMITVAIAGAAVSAGISVSITRTLAQAPVASATAPAAALKTPWGEPDLQGIWTEETDTPLQRPAKYASPVAIDRDLQDQVPDLCRGQVRSDAVAATRGTSSSLHRDCLGVHQSPRWSGGRHVDGALLDRRTTRIWNPVWRELKRRARCRAPPLPVWVSRGH